MDRLKALATFKAVVDKGGFSRAAADLDLSCAQVTRAVQDLEQQLGVRLLQRTTRHVSLTAIGEDVLQRAVALLDGYAELAALSKLSATTLTGTIRLAVPTSFGRWLMARSLAGFMSSHPEVRVDLRLDDRPLDLCRAEDDLAICQSRDLRPSLIARQVASCEVGLYAAPEYLARTGVPGDVLDLASRACLGTDEGRGGDWRLRRADDDTFIPVAVQRAFDTANADLVVDAAEHGAGIALLPAFIVETSLRHQRLQRVLPEWQAEPLVLHLAYRSRDNQPLAVRRLIEHLVASLHSGGRPAATPARTIAPLSHTFVPPVRAFTMAGQALAA